VRIWKLPDQGPSIRHNHRSKGHVKHRCPPLGDALAIVKPALVELKHNESARLVLFAPEPKVPGVERRLAACSDKGTVKLWKVTMVAGGEVGGAAGGEVGGEGGEATTMVATIWQTVERSTCSSSMALAWSPCARFLAVMERTVSAHSSVFQES
jgi:hypothetical protein